MVMQMKDYAGREYNGGKVWIADQCKKGRSWEEIAHLCAEPGEEEDAFDRLQNEELILPDHMEFEEWPQFVANVRSSYVPVVEMYGIADKNANVLGVPTKGDSAWAGYKELLLGRKDGKQRMSGGAVSVLEGNVHWMLNHLERDTRGKDPVKGLVMGSVQSGKTANMIGLVTMAADYDWNVFIVLSGTIDSLRKQTQQRFYHDLFGSGRLNWHVLDYTRAAERMVDIRNGNEYRTDALDLNRFQDGETSPQWLHRYVIVCLKHQTRLRNLIAWLHADKQRAAKMRIVVIDDEADQASINTAKMTDVQDEEEIERTAVNALIICLVKGCNADGTVSAVPFQAMNYISFTATPYANVLNEAYRDSLYPSNFICSLPESKEYFGAKAIWGSGEDAGYTGLNIVRTIPGSEMAELKLLQKGNAAGLPMEFKRSVAWFLCAAGILRRRGWKQPISMLIHTVNLQRGHFEEYEALRAWLQQDKAGIIGLCSDVYQEEKDEFHLQDLREGYPDYARMDEVCDEFPVFETLRAEIARLLADIANIGLGEGGQMQYHENGIHLCVDNCSANRAVGKDTFLRIAYPSPAELDKMTKAPVFIVIGGNTLSRGLTLEGLVCTYFARNVNQADSLMQMARWFGYRRGYELLQRIWMPVAVQEKFALLEEIDEHLKREFEDFMQKGKSPAVFGPRVMSSSRIARFLLTSASKSQNMEACDLDFTGNSYEVTQFEDDEVGLLHNIEATEAFLTGLGAAEKSDAIESAYCWRGVPSKDVMEGFLQTYKIFDCSPLCKDIPLFEAWLRDMNAAGHFLHWDVAVAGDKKAAARWRVAGADVGKIVRSRKVKAQCIDIGSLRSGRDVLSDVAVSRLDEKKKSLFAQGKKRGTNLIRLRYDLGLVDVPLLLLYRIDREQGKISKYRTKIGTAQDIIGFSIVIAGQESNEDFVRSVRVRKPE